MFELESVEPRRRAHGSQLGNKWFAMRNEARKMNEKRRRRTWRIWSKCNKLLPHAKTLADDATTQNAMLQRVYVFEQYFSWMPSHIISFCWNFLSSANYAARSAPIFFHSIHWPVLVCARNRFAVVYYPNFNEHPNCRHCDASWPPATLKFNYFFVLVCVRRQASVGFQRDFADYTSASLSMTEPKRTKMKKVERERNKDEWEYEQKITGK